MKTLSKNIGLCCARTRTQISSEKQRIKLKKEFLDVHRFLFDLHNLRELGFSVLGLTLTPKTLNGIIGGLVGIVIWVISYLNHVDNQD